MSSQASAASSARVTLAPTVPGLDALGAVSAEDLIGTGDGLVQEVRAERVASDAHGELLRCPLPGTLEGRPRGAGTGWIYLRRYRDADWTECLRSRLTAPRSDSLAGREWNLLCFLRSAGVTAPEPMAVVGESHPVFARRSALVTRALEAMSPAPDWFARETDLRRRRNAARAIGLVLARLFRSGLDLPRLAPAHLWVSDPEPESDCGRERPPVELRVRSTPEVAIASVRGGRIFPRPRRSRVAATLEQLARSEAAAILEPHELRAIALRAVRGLGWSRRARAALLDVAR